MLSEVQIERYCRQIILPGIGSGGQERLLESSVALHGEGDTLLLCASYLAGAGVGTLTVDRVDQAFTAMIARRNPDCRVTATADAALTVALRNALPVRLSSATTLVWGDDDAAGVRIARFAPRRSCLACLAPVASASRGGGESAGALGTLVALESLRILLGLAPLRGASLVTIDLDRGETRSTRFPSRSDCPTCSQGEME